MRHPLPFFMSFCSFGIILSKTMRACPRKLDLQYAPYCSFVLICIKGTFILEQCNDLFFTWHQHWINVHKLGSLHFPSHHLFLIVSHQMEEHIIVILHHIWSLMTIHVHSLPQQFVPPAQPHKPSLSHVF